MKRLFPLLALLLFSQPLFAMVRAGVEIDSDDDGYYYYDDGYWQGPGFYYGIWFDNRYEYDDWRRGRYYYYRDGYYHRRDRYYDRHDRRRHH